MADDALSKRGILTLTYPMQHGFVMDWDAMEKIWHHTFFSELRIAPEDHPVLLTEPLFNPKASRERMMRLFLEVFGVPAVYVETKAVLAVYGARRTTGLVLHAGEGNAHAVPVYEGNVVPHAVCYLYLTGNDLTDALTMALNEKGMMILTPNAEREICSELKQQVGCVAQDPALLLSDRAWHWALIRVVGAAFGSLRATTRW